jgi:hypothetical protein
MEHPNSIDNFFLRAILRGRGKTMKRIVPKATSVRVHTKPVLSFASLYNALAASGLQEI